MNDRPKREPSGWQVLATGSERTPAEIRVVPASGEAILTHNFYGSAHRGRIDKGKVGFEKVPRTYYEETVSHSSGRAKEKINTMENFLTLTMPVTVEIAEDGVQNRLITADIRYIAANFSNSTRDERNVLWMMGLFGNRGRYVGW